MISIIDSFYYLDPGTTSYIFQVILAASVTALIYLRNIKSLILNFINKIKNRLKNN